MVEEEARPKEKTGFMKLDVGDKGAEIKLVPHLTPALLSCLPLLLHALSSHVPLLRSVSLLLRWTRTYAICSSLAPERAFFLASFPGYVASERITVPLRLLVPHPVLGPPPPSFPCLAVTGKGKGRRRRSNDRPCLPSHPTEARVPQNDTQPEGPAGSHDDERQSQRGLRRSSKTLTL